MTETKTRVQQFAAEREMTYNEFAARCLLRGLSYETAKDVWYGVVRPRGFNTTTKVIIAKILRRTVGEVFDE